MSYIKTNWVDNTTPIDSTNMNKIEQGIYDNSLVADAVNNVVKPNDETYKDVEITEGQITDVLAVNDVLIKGNTLQDGEPTPDSPVDINVVSGSNIVYTSNKNLFNPSNIIANTNIDANGNLVDASNNNLYYISVISGEKYTMTRGQSRQWVYNFFKTIPQKGQQGTARVVKISTVETFTVPDGYNYIVVRQIEGGGELINNLMILKGTYTTAPGYVPHQGKELPLDLPVENLFDGAFNQGGVDFGGAGQSTAVSNRINTNLIPVNPNTTYTVSNHNSNIYQFGIGLYKSDETYDSDHKINNGGWNNFPYTFTTQNDTYYVKMAFKNANDTTLSPTGDYKIMLNKGSKVNAYTPYGTTPIELCKIGDYQDYFYKSGNDWYLHKEIGKYTLDGINNTFEAKTSATANNIFRTYQINDILPQNNINAICSNFGHKLIADINSTDIIGFGTRNDKIINFGFGLSSSINTLELANQFLQNNNVLIYYPLGTATNTQITDTTLISQLEAIYNAPLYEQTNITQTNNDLPIILDITAFKDNINGIKAWIRK